MAVLMRVWSLLGGLALLRSPDLLSGMSLLLRSNLLSLLGCGGRLYCGLGCWCLSRFGLGCGL